MKVSDPGLSDGNSLYFLISSLGEWFLEPPSLPSPPSQSFFNAKKNKNAKITIVLNSLSRPKRIDVFRHFS